MYSFKDDVLKQLPEGQVFSRIYSISDTETIVEAKENSAVKTYTLPKVDISSLFTKLPTIAVGTSWTYNDLYAKISDIYSLGLVQGIDYYNNQAVKPSVVARIEQLPISKDSYGYYGNIPCNVVIGTLAGISNETKRDLRGGLGPYLKALKLQSFLMSKRFGCDCGANFIGDRFSGLFIEGISQQAKEELSEEMGILLADILSGSFIDFFFSDGVSDICSLKGSNGEIFLIRIRTLSNDIPIFSNEGIDVKTDNSKGLLVGMRLRMSENPEEGKGEINIQQSDSDISVLLVTPEESTDQVTEEVKEEVTPPVKKTRKKKSN